MDKPCEMKPWSGWAGAELASRGSGRVAVADRVHTHMPGISSARENQTERELRDSDIRAALHLRLQTQHQDDPATQIVNEMGVLKGGCRIDVAVINGRLEGFEIKSDRDTLDRLPRQAEAYGRVFDRVTAVCGPRHVEEAKLYVPCWWGIAAAQPTDGGVRIVQRRSPRTNPNVEPEAVVQLLWREETLAALEMLGKADGLRSKPRQVLWRALAETQSPRALRRLVRKQLRAREGWPTAG
jgi:hypothetical protein